MTREPQLIRLSGSSLRLAFRDWGGSGHPLILLHGLSSNSRIWDFTAPLLASHLRVIALDLPGHGLSDSSGDYSFRSVSADVASFLDALELHRAYIAGHSWGGSVALHFAAHNPRAAAALALVDGGLITPSGGMSWEEAEQVMRPPDIDGTPVETFLGFVRQWPDFRDNWSEDVADIFLSNFRVEDGRIYRRLPVPRHMEIAREIYGLRPMDLLSGLACPVMAISCRREPGTDTERAWQERREDALEQVRREAPSVRVVVMEDTIHDVPVQRPQALAEALISFFSELP
jgi:pimeloyl-ACP methyl ester carboxylesterase